MAKWFLGSACFAAFAMSTHINAWMLPSTFCAVMGFAWGFRNGR